MRLTSGILIERPPQTVWSFLGDPANVAKWDRGVGGVEEASSVPHGVGYEFDTVAHENMNLPGQGRMSYRVREVDVDAGSCVVELTSRDGNARFFRTAEWQFHVAAHGYGSELTCTAEFTLRTRYLFLGPLLYLKRSAILLDLTLLKNAIEGMPA
jgi:carbon monoxide dehydrogenase subunit G